VYVVAVDVEAAVPIDDLTKLCLEPETIKHLRRVREFSDNRDLE
jgi:hypothetical protein